MRLPFVVPVWGVEYIRKPAQLIQAFFMKATKYTFIVAHCYLAQQAISQNPHGKNVQIPQNILQSVFLRCYNTAVGCINAQKCLFGLYTFADTAHAPHGDGNSG